MPSSIITSQRVAAWTTSIGASVGARFASSDTCACAGALGCATTRTTTRISATIAPLVRYRKQRPCASRGEFDAMSATVPGVLIDVMRLVFRRSLGTIPTGIDRVGLEYIR